MSAGDTIPVPAALLGLDVLPTGLYFTLLRKGGPHGDAVILGLLDPPSLGVAGQDILRGVEALEAVGLVRGEWAKRWRETSVRLVPLGDLGEGGGT